MAEKLTEDPIQGLEQADQSHIDQRFAQIVEEMAVNGTLPEGVSLDQAMQVASALGVAREQEADSTYEQSYSVESAEEDRQTFVDRIKERFGWKPKAREEDDKFNQDSLSILDSLGSTNAATPEHGIPETDEVKEMLGAKVVGAMVAGSEEDNRFARETLWELHTNSTDAVDRVTYDALDSLLQLSNEIAEGSIDQENAEVRLAEEVEKQVLITSRKDGGGKDARLQIEAMAAQIARRVAPGGELHGHLILDANRTAAAISEGESRLTAT